MAIVGYARVSTRGQSLDAQIKALKENGVEDVNLFSEKESGANNSRSELSNMLKFVLKAMPLSSRSGH
jgi:DNA invertase Pin-like site-specific DNA recombinase